MDLLEIARRTGIEPRRLRYAIYHTLMPGVSPVDVGRGSVRRFTEFEAFGIALAAMLLDAGLKRNLVTECIDLLARRAGRETPTNDIPLFRAFASRGTARLDVADGRYVRLRIGSTVGRKSPETAWERTNGGRPVPTDYDPLVLLSVNVTPLREALRGKPRA